MGSAKKGKRQNEEKETCSSSRLKSARAYRIASSSQDNEGPNLPAVFPFGPCYRGAKGGWKWLQQGKVKEPNFTMFSSTASIMMHNPAIHKSHLDLGFESGALQVPSSALTKAKSTPLQPPPLLAHPHNLRASSVCLRCVGLVLPNPG